MTTERPPAWKGHQLNALRANQAVRADLGRRLEEVKVSLEAQIAEVDLRVREELGRVIGIDPEAVHEGGWRCSGSPTGWCIYDNHEDSWHDDCLICGEPSDRG